jgi:AcrR family transcriptional regulator
MQPPQGVSDQDGDGAVPPAWRLRAVERSLGRSRVEAELRSSRFVEAALRLVESTDGGDFTIQEVVEETRVSTRTFYQYFSGKDELLVAMFEELQRAANRELREQSGSEADALSRLRTFVVGSIERSGGARGTTGSSRLLVQQWFRLQLSHPQELRESFRPLVAYLSDLVAAASEAGHFRALHPARSAALVLQMVMSASQGAIIGSSILDPPPTPEQVWEFCLAGIGGLRGEPSAPAHAKANE